jgi:predicted PurR-regulated permease PerM
MEDKQKAPAQPLGQPPTDPPALREAAQHAGAAWRRLLLRLRAITPQALARMLLVGGAVAALVWLFASAWTALVPFLVGALLAYAALPAVNALDRIMPRRLAAALTLLTVFSILGLFVALLIPSLAQQFLRLTRVLPPMEDIQTFLDRVDVSLETLPEPARQIVADVLEQLVMIVRNGIDEFNTNLPQMVVNTALGVIQVVGAMLGLLLLPLWMLTVLTDQRKGTQALNRLLPQWAQGDFWAVMRILDRSFRAFFQQQVKQGILVGLAAYAVTVAQVRMDLIQVQFPLVTAMFVGLMELVPEIGPTVAVVTLAFTGALISPLYGLVAPGIYLLLHWLIGSFVAGRTTRQVQEIHPVPLVLIAVAFSQLGLAWVLFSVPISMALRDLFRYTYGRLADPPVPAGRLPDQQMLATTRVVPRRPVPAAYRRGRAARVSSSGESLSSDQAALVPGRVVSDG